MSKSLNHYIDAKISELLKENGCFFAFDNKQFKEQATEGVQYVQMDNQAICPKENAQKFHDGLKKIIADGVAERLKDCGRDAIILYELNNHECFYTGDICENTLSALSPYAVTEKEARAVLNKNWDKYCD